MPQKDQKVDPLLILQGVKTPDYLAITEVKKDFKGHLSQKLSHFAGKEGFLPLLRDKRALIKWAGTNGITLEEALSFTRIEALGMMRKGFLVFDFDDPKSLDHIAESGVDFTEKSWHIRRSDNLLRFKSIYKPTSEQLAQLPYGGFQKVDLYGAGLDLFVDSKGMIVVGGRHKNGGWYYSPKGLHAEDLAPPSNEAWNYVLKAAEHIGVPPKPSPRNSGETTRLDPCPICSRHSGRNGSSLWCDKTSDGLILCMVGQSFSAEKAHGSLKEGDIINDYALVKKRDDCLTFRLHRPRVQRRFKPPTRRCGGGVNA